MSNETILKGLEAIERRIDRDMREFGDRLLMLEQKGVMSGHAAPRGGGRTLGQQFAEQLEKNSDLFQKAGRITLELSTKAASDPVTTTSGRTIVSGGVGAIVGRVLGLQYGLRRRPSPGVTAVEYSRYTGQEGAAAIQASEGAAKAFVRPTHSLITQTAITIAGLTKISRQAMTDRAELEQAIDVTLRRSLDTALDVLLATGGTGFAGGYEALATAVTSTLYDTLPDAISEGVAAMQTAGFQPDVVALRPSDWLGICVAKGTSNDHYLSGSYLGPLPETMRGLRVVLSASITSGKALLMDSSHIELLDVEGVTVEAAYDSDDFSKNLITLRGEQRVIPKFYTAGAARLITPSA